MDCIPELDAGAGKVTMPKQVAICLDTVVRAQEEGDHWK